MLESCSHPYKLTIKIEPTEEGSKLPTIQKEFVIIKSEAEQFLFKICRDINLPLKPGDKVLIKEWSQSLYQFGIIINKTVWGGYNIKFPLGLGDRLDSHRREFYHKFVIPINYGIIDGLQVDIIDLINKLIKE